MKYAGTVNGKLRAAITRPMPISALEMSPPNPCAISKSTPSGINRKESVICAGTKNTKKKGLGGAFFTKHPERIAAPVARIPIALA